MLKQDAIEAEVDSERIPSRESLNDSRVIRALQPEGGSEPPADGRAPLAEAPLAALSHPGGVAEAVADAAHRFDQAGVLAQLLAERADMHVDRTLQHQRVAAQRRVDQF